MKVKTTVILNNGNVVILRASDDTKDIFINREDETPEEWLRLWPVDSVHEADRIEI